ACALPANQHGQRGDSPRRFGVPGRTGGAGHAPVRGPARDRVAVACRRASGDRGEGRAGAERGFGFTLNAALPGGGRCRDRKGTAESASWRRCRQCFDMAWPRRAEVGAKPKSPGASRGSPLCLGYARIRVRGRILLLTKRDQRLELVTARFAFPKMPNAVPV